MKDGFVKTPRCPFCDADRLTVGTNLDVAYYEMSYNGAGAAVVAATVTIICDACHKTIFEKDFEE